MKRQKHIIRSVESGSIAEELGLEAGDEVLSVNGEAILDVLDYRFQETGEDILLLVRKKSGEEWELEIEKDYADELGIEFEDPLMDDYRSCRNKCIFCFIDQLPKGMRETLYFKDDDTRLSFLQGNYCTLTNLSEEDIERICYYKLSPINISVHTTNPELRKKLLGNRFAGKIEEIIARLCEAGLNINAQIVLCKGFNDKKELDRTIADLEKYIPNILSLSVVPSGMTRFRENLAKLEPFTAEDCARVIDQIELWQQHMLYAHKTRFVYPSDEFYIMAGRPLPSDSDYEGYVQLENGVGMMRSLIEDTKLAMESYLEDGGKTDIVRHISLATGALAYEHIKQLTESICEHFPGIKVDVYKVINNFFGESITVSGLLTGGDLIAQLKNKELFEELQLPENLLKSGEDVLLDDVTLPEIEKALQTKIRIVKSYGDDFFNAIIGINGD